ncbi:MAG: hypothetical protein KME13_25685 [Myxacorys californica WJT36-NPBG1]|nr:hypothetical protein [Myxacorys californica WJT36-NPBG1]
MLSNDGKTCPKRGRTRDCLLSAAIQVFAQAGIAGAATRQTVNTQAAGLSLDLQGIDD